MPISDELSELYSERDFLTERLSATSRYSPQYESIWRRIDRLNVAIRIRRDLSSWRKVDVHVVATSLQEARAIAKLTGWPTRREARRHLRTIKDGIARSCDQSVSLRSYRVWRVRIFRALKKNEALHLLQ